MRNFILLLCTIVGIGTLHHLFAQAVVDQPILSPTYIAVPAVYDEVKPAPPAQTNGVWQPGYWEWRGTWVGMPDVYVQQAAPAVPNATWVAGQWITGIYGS